MLGLGTKAPEFTSLNQDWKEVSLSGFKGTKVVLYFCSPLGTSETGRAEIATI